MTQAIHFPSHWWKMVAVSEECQTQSCVRGSKSRTRRETSSKNLNGRASATSQLQRTDTWACTWLSRTTFYIFVRGADYFTPVLTCTSFTPLANRLDFELSPVSFSPHKNKLVAQLLIQCWGAAATPEEEEEILLELLGFWWLGFGVFIAVMSNDREWP